MLAVHLAKDFEVRLSFGQCNLEYGIINLVVFLAILESHHIVIFRERLYKRSCRRYDSLILT